MSPTALCRITERCHDITLEDWALTEVLNRTRERLNAGKTAAHQSRNTADDPTRNERVERAGMAGEVIMMRLLRDAGAHASALEYMQRGLIHADIRSAHLKGQPDLLIDGLRLDIKVNRLLSPTEKGYACRVNQVKHNQLVANGLDGYVFVALQEYSSVCFVSRIVTPHEVASWTLTEREHPGKNDLSQHLSVIARKPARLIYNRSEHFRHKFERREVEELFNDAAFGDTIRSKYPYVDWSLVWSSKSPVSTWTP